MITLAPSTLAAANLAVKEWPIANPLAGLNRLQNEYWILRHARGVINEREILCSSPDSGLCTGLTPGGRSRITVEALPAVYSAIGSKPIVILHSPLPRAAETVDALYAGLGPEKVLHRAAHPGLCDRSWGAAEGRPESEWTKIMQWDRRNPFEGPAGAESMLAFIQRVGRTFVEIENDFSGATILVVSHADYLQVADHLFQRRTALTHYSVNTRMLKYLELRRLQLKAVGSNGNNGDAGYFWPPE